MIILTPGDEDTIVVAQTRQGPLQQTSCLFHIFKPIRKQTAPKTQKVQDKAEWFFDSQPWPAYIAQEMRR